MTVPATGLYIIEGSAVWIGASPTGSSVAMEIAVNSTPSVNTIGGHATLIPASVTNNTALKTFRMMGLNKGDKIVITAWQSQNHQNRNIVIWGRYYYF